MEETEALVVLNNLSFQRKIKALPLLKWSDSPLAALNMVSPSLWHPLNEWKEDLKLIEENKISLIGIDTPSYPQNLNALKDPPLLLYVKGDLKERDREALAIVGTRRCSLYGKEMAERIARDVAASNVTVVSGLAHGIDTSAHLGALQAGRTLAILGTGLCHIYPKENKHLATQVIKSGALISEFPMMTTPKPYYFPRRNRLIAALSHGILLVEGPQKSGGMITLEIARSLNKTCFALPGRADMETFGGNHSLIKKNYATLVENAQEMLSQLKLIFLNVPKQQDLFALTDQEKYLLDCFPDEEVSVDELFTKTQLSIAELSAQLLELCLKGNIREYPGKLYKKAIK